MRLVSLCNVLIQTRRLQKVKSAFHDTDTDILARIVARKIAPRVGQVGEDVRVGVVECQLMEVVYIPMFFIAR